MDYNQLSDFISNRMKMSHVYQPLLIRSLVDAGGSATPRQLAQFFLSQDESQLLYYENRIKEMPLKVVKNLTVEQKAHIRNLEVSKTSVTSTDIGELNGN